MTETNTQKPKNRAVLVGLWAYRLEREENATEESMEELADLLETAGGECVGTVLQQKDSPRPPHLHRRGQGGGGPGAGPGHGRRHGDL